MKPNDYVKYLTETVVKYIDQPKEERRRYHEEKKEMREPFLLKWFGIFPYVFYEWVIKNKRRKKPM